MVPGPAAQCRQGRATFALDVTPEMFEFMETIWQPPTVDEMAARNGRRVAPGSA